MQPEESQVNEPNECSLGNISSNPHPQPDPLASITTEQVRKLNSMLESLGLVPQSSNTKCVCSKEDGREVASDDLRDALSVIFGLSELKIVQLVYYIEGLNHNHFLVGQFCDADLEVAFWKSTCFVRDLQGNDLLTDLMRSKRCRDICDNKHFGLVIQRQKASDYDNSGPAPQLQNVSPSTDTIAPSEQELDLLFGPLYDEFFNAGTSSVNKSSSPIDNSKQHDTPPTIKILSSIEPTTPTNVHDRKTTIIKQ
ncbi:hypothetical protein Tco_0851249 [Tanacetum coccineum]